MKITTEEINRRLQNLKDYRVGKIYDGQINSILTTIHFLENLRDVFYKENKKLLFNYLEIKKDVIFNVDRNYLRAKKENEKIKNEILFDGDWASVKFKGNNNFIKEYEDIFLKDDIIINFKNNQK